MEISGIGSSLDSTQMAQNFFKKADSNSDGSIDKAELKTMLSNGPGGGKAAGNIDKIFAEVDTNSDGKIDETENAAQMNKMAAKGGGNPPAGAPSSPGGSASTDNTSSSSTKTYDKMDANKDGTVSLQEKIEYEIKHPEVSKNQNGSLNLLA
jgi:hypothetical protein